MLDKLEYLIALAREQNFGRAAEACCVTQPSFSAAIRALEEKMGVPLVIRRSRFQGFTPEGERVLEWARRITGDVHAMRDDVNSLKRGLNGLLRIAAIPTALATIAELTTPYRARHPLVRFSVLSCTSSEVLQRLHNQEIEAGITYLDNEPVGKARSVPLYEERYMLLTSAQAPLGERARVTWAEIGKIPLCLLTPDMQNRRIINRLLNNAGQIVEPTLESNSIVVLVSHVQTGRWACVMPEKLAEVFGLTAKLRAIPIVEPEEVRKVGLVVLDRDPLSPLTAALIAEASRLRRV
ncbi:MAG: LysR family transcriptional regulator [Acidocella sp.]|nr:LysR family transcriptional regulator [Acidocella sp.]NNM57696.1 LysR family transcriptional regulator [Acidocella sp.]